MIPIPPSLAIAIAIFDSVTVSIPALIIGMFSLIFLVNLVSVLVCFGNISEKFGTSSISSNVNASPINSIFTPLFLILIS